MKEGFCASCGQWLRLKDDEYVLPYHDWPKPTRRICDGAKKPPVHSRPVMTMTLATIWRTKSAEAEGLDPDSLRVVDWLMEQADYSLQALRIISRITEDEDGERPTAEAKLALKTLRKLGHVES